MITDLTPRDGVWSIPAHDPLDDPHTIALGQWLGSRRADGSPVLELCVRFGAGEGGVLAPDEARMVAAAMIAAADYAEACEVVTDGIA